jgi:hypothetical protein
MSIYLIDNFELGVNKPIDNRFIVGAGFTYPNKDSINNKYLGLRVWDTSVNQSFIWNGSTFSAESILGATGPTGPAGGSPELVNVGSGDVTLLASDMGKIYRLHDTSVSQDFRLPEGTSAIEGKRVGLLNENQTLVEVVAHSGDLFSTTGAQIGGFFSHFGEYFEFLWTGSFWVLVVGEDILREVSTITLKGSPLFIPSENQGYLICDGSAVSQGDYPRLFGIIGFTYGNSGGAGTFDLPIPVGVSEPTVTIMRWMIKY